MRRFPFWVNLILIISATCSMKGQSFEWGIDRQHDLYAQQRAIKLQGGRLWIYRPTDLKLECLDLSGNLLLRIELAESTDIALSDFKPKDYVVDDQGSAYVAGVALDSQSKRPFTYLLSFDSAGQKTGECRLQPMVAVERVAVAPDGNLAMLGLDQDGMSLELKASHTSSTIKLVHVFSPSGSWLSSRGAMEAPSDSNGWARLRGALDRVLIADRAGKIYFQPDGMHLLYVTPDGGVGQVEIPTTGRQLRLVVSLVLSRNGLLAVLAEGLNQYDAEITRTSGLFAMENPKEAAYILGPDGLRLVKGDLGTRIVGQIDDGRWVKAKFTDGRVVFSVEDQL